MSIQFFTRLPQNTSFFFLFMDVIFFFFLCIQSPLGQKRLSDSRVVAHISNVHTHAHVIWHERPAYHRVCHLSSTCQTDGLLEMTNRLQTEMRSSNIQAKRMCSCNFCVYVCLSVCVNRRKVENRKGRCKEKTERLRGANFLCLMVEVQICTESNDSYSG